MENVYKIIGIENKDPKAPRYIDDADVMYSEIDVLHLEIGERMVFVLVDGSGQIRTSTVENIVEGQGGSKAITTRNTIYYLSAQSERSGSVYDDLAEELGLEEQASSLEYSTIESLNNLIATGKEIKLFESAGEISDGHHTFNELYEHRMVLFALLCNTYKDKAWKSWKHDDGTMFDGMFICGIHTPDGQYTYHYSAKHWDKFEVAQLLTAPEYDGHQPSDIDRLFSLMKEFQI